jgi:fumarate reductase subunit D
MVAILVVGTIIGLIWADTSDLAGVIAVVTNIVGGVGIVLLLIALVVVTRRRGTRSGPAANRTPRRL